MLRFNAREPTTESQWGKEIRDRSYRGELTPDEELELFLKDRDWHIKNRILPALNDNKIVLLDRYFFATGAYQSASTGIPTFRARPPRHHERFHARRWHGVGCG